MARMCETSVSTISRDIEFMRDQLLAPIDYDPLNRGYYYSQKTYRLPAGFTSAEDLLALGMAKSILSLYRETPLFEASSHLLESIIAPIVSDSNKDWLENRIVVPKIASAKVDPGIWEIVVTALKGNLVITFDYRGIWNRECQNRRVRPYQLLFDSGVWYLYGFAEERKSVRIFSLSRLNNASLTKDVFSLPQTFSYSVLSGDSYFGIFIGEEKYRFVIDCFGEAVNYATERQWAADQKITKRNNGVTIEFTSTQDYKVLKWVLSNGSDVVPRKPKKLVDEWKRHISKMRKLAAK
jgi:predicted DNA-binding transcriptional regulator YafY